MKKKTDGDIASDDVKDTLPSLEDILSPASWDDRIAKARARREKVLSKGNKTKPASHPSDTTEGGVPGIEEILATANWTDRLAKAKAHRDQVIAERTDAGQPPPAQLPGKMPALYKDTVRVAVSGISTIEEKTKAATVFPVIEPAANTQKRRFGAGYIAAGILLALGVGLLAPSPFRKSVTVAEQTPAAVIDPAPQTEVFASQTSQPAEKQGNQSVTLTSIDPQLPQPVVSDTVGVIPVARVANVAPAIAPVADEEFALRPVVNSTLQPPVNELAPIIRTDLFVARASTSTEGLSNVALTEVATPSKPVLGIAPEYLDTITAFQIGADSTEIAGNSQFRPTVFENVKTLSAPVVIEAVKYQPEVDILNVRALRGPIGASSTNTIAFVSPASMEASYSNFQNSELSRPDVSAVNIQTDSDHSIRPTNIVFLSGPALSEVPISTPLPLRHLEVEAGMSDIVFGNIGEISQSLDFVAPVLVKHPVQLASFGPIPLAALQQEPEIVADTPESFEALATRFASLSPEVVEETPGYPGADAFTIHLHAPKSLADKKLGAFATALRDTGFAVKEPKRVNFTIRKNNVRYFHASDAEAARVLAAAVDAKARDFTDYSPSPPVGTIEVWLAGKTPTASSTKPARRPANNNAAINQLRNRLLLSLRRGDHL